MISQFSIFQELQAQLLVKADLIVYDCFSSIFAVPE